MATKYFYWTIGKSDQHQQKINLDFDVHTELPNVGFKEDGRITLVDTIDCKNDISMIIYLFMMQLI